MLREHVPNTKHQEHQSIEFLHVESLLTLKCKLNINNTDQCLTLSKLFILYDQRAAPKCYKIMNTLDMCIVLWVRVQVPSGSPQDLLFLVFFIEVHLSFRQLTFRCSRQILLPLLQGKRKRGVPRVVWCFSQNSIFSTIRRQSWNSKLDVHSFAYTSLTLQHLKRQCSISWNIHKEFWGFVSLIVSCQCSYKPYHTFSQMQVANI